ncbi:MAG: hypothetical protein ACM3UO_00085 [Bacillota bacterium]
MSRPFAAKYAGRCGACAEWFEEGTQIVITGEVGVVHDNCPDNDEFKIGEVCTDCWMEYSVTGQCGCGL